MLVDIEWLENTKNRLKEINNCDIDDITWLRRKEEVKFTSEQKEEFGFTGLNNTDFLWYITLEEE